MSLRKKIILFPVSLIENTLILIIKIVKKITPKKISLFGRSKNKIGEREKEVLHQYNRNLFIQVDNQINNKEHFAKIENGE